MAYEIIFLIGRLLLGGFFLLMSMNHFTQTKMLTDYATSKKVPYPQLAVIFAGLLLVIGAVTFILGVYPQIGILAITLFFIPTTLMMHDFWNVPKEQKMQEKINFLKNMALEGAVVMLLIIPTPWPLSISLLF